VVFCGYNTRNPARDFSRRLFLCDRPDRSDTRAAPIAQRFRDDHMMIAVNP
jgi:hypothetical protein